MEKPLITLLTDFGPGIYVGIMKGVIWRRCPTANIVDLSHTVKAQNISEGAFLLDNAYSYFPPGTVHVAVVDPGVGSARRAIGLDVPEIGVFVGPDNGLFTPILARHPNAAAYVLDNPAFHLQPISSTFHGRDIFSPVAAALASGTGMAEIGSPVSLSSLQPLPYAAPHWTDKGKKRILEGQVVHIDHFGNVISNISAAMLAHLTPQQIAKLTFFAKGYMSEPATTGLKQTYTDGKPGKLIALVSSSGYIEIARVNGRACDYMPDAGGQTNMVVVGAPFKITLAE